MNTTTEISQVDALAAMRRAAAVAWDEGYANGRNDEHLDSSEPTPNPYRTPVYRVVSAGRRRQETEMSDALHRDDRPWWERDQRTWADAVDWFAFWIGAPIVVVLAVVAGVAAVLG